MSLPVAWQSRPSGSLLHWTAFGILSAAAVGWASTIGTTAALGVVVAIAVVLLALLHPASILAILGISIFLELVSVGGVSISRLLAPLALLIILVELIRGGASVRMEAPLAWVVVNRPQARNALSAAAKRGVSPWFAAPSQA